MARLWLTYAWKDNENRDVDFVAQELETTGLTVKLDRWNIQAGKRLWEQIQDHITNAELSDAWLMYATQNSLGSEACREEFAYALDRALHSRGQAFPIIALFPSTVDRELIPPAIRVRLYVSLTDPHWKERIKAAAAGREPEIPHEQISPYAIQIHEQKGSYAIEVRPRAGTSSPFFAAIPVEEKGDVQPDILRGPRGHVPSGGVLQMYGETQSSDGEWWIMYAADEASPTQSYFILCPKLPTILKFGARNDADQQYTVRLGGEP